jgi:hypothetical protein
MAYIVFNMTRETITEELNVGEAAAIRNPWTKENLPCASNMSVEVEPHGVCILRVTPA